MPTFVPPTDNTVSPVYLGGQDAYRPVPALSQRLFRFFGARPAGRNIFKLTDGSYTEDRPYPYIDASTQPGQAGATTVLVTYLGGHSYDITQPEADALTAAGYGSGIT